MYAYIEQMWRLSASERAELKVKHRHTSRVSRETYGRTRGMLLGSYSGLWGINIAQEHPISSGEPSQLACPARWRRGSTPQMNSRGIREHEFRDGDPSRGEKGSLEFPAR